MGIFVALAGSVILLRHLESQHQSREAGGAADVLDPIAKLPLWVTMVGLL
jgi:hypothetical protein